MKSNKNKIKNNKITLSNLENSLYKKSPELSNGNLYTTNYSTLFTNSNFNNTKYSNMDYFPTPLSPTISIAYNTIDDYSRDIFYLSKINIEYDLYLSSLKKKLSLIKEERKQSEINVTNVKRRIFELQKEEQKSLKQLENTRDYIKKIFQNRKKHTINKFKYDKKYKKINNISQTNRSPINKIITPNNYSCHTWFAPSKKKNILKKNLTQSNYYSGPENNNNIYHSMYQNKLFMESINSKNSAKINMKVYSKKKIRLNKKKYKNKIQNKLYNNKVLKQNLINTIKKEEEEKIKIEKQLKEIEKEQNNLFNKFLENVGVYHSYKTPKLKGNIFNFDKLKK